MCNLVYNTLSVEITIGTMQIHRTFKGSFQFSTLCALHIIIKGETAYVWLLHNTVHGKIWSRKNW